MIESIFIYYLLLGVLIGIAHIFSCKQCDHNPFSFTMDLLMWPLIVHSYIVEYFKKPEQSQIISVRIEKESDIPDFLPDELKEHLQNVLKERQIPKHPVDLER